MPTILELQQKRNNLVELGRGIFKKAQDEKRAPTPEENLKFDEYMNGSDAVKAEITALETDANRSKRLKDAEEELRTRTGRKTDGGDPDPNAGKEEARAFKFPNRRKNGQGLCAVRSMDEIKLSTTTMKYGKMGTPEARTQFAGWLRDGGKEDELRNLQVDLDTAGGFLVTPQQFAAEIIAIVDNQVFLRQLATVMTLTSATTLGIPTRDVDIADSDWTSELNTGNEDALLGFGKRELMPHPLAKRIRVSNKLLRAGALDVESIVRDRLAYKFAVTQEKAFILGNGVQQPMGFMVPTSLGIGISTARDVATGTAGAITADGLITSKYTLKPQYWKNARWGFHRLAIAAIRKLKDSNGQYLWNPSGIGQASLVAGQADAILDLPFFVSEYMPATLTTGLYYGILGDFSFYWIAEALSMQLQRLVELYAVSNQTGYIPAAAGG